METTESKAISSLSVYMYFADISIVNSEVREVYAHVYHLGHKIICSSDTCVWLHSAPFECISRIVYNIILMVYTSDYV